MYNINVAIILLILAQEWDIVSNAMTVLSPKYNYSMFPHNYINAKIYICYCFSVETNMWW